MSGSRDERQAAPIDRAALAAISQGDEAIERRLLSIFRTANAADAATLERALEQRDVVAVTSAAHRVVGASKMAGATTLAAICASVAQASAAGDWDAVAAQRDALHRELERLGAYLDSQLKSPPDAS